MSTRSPIQHNNQPTALDMNIVPAVGSAVNLGSSFNVWGNLFADTLSYKPKDPLDLFEQVRNIPKEEKNE